MKTLTVMMMLLVLVIAGCGVNKNYVNQQVEESEARSIAQIDALSDKTNANAAELQKLQSLAVQLSDKTDMAINQAAGFETYQVIWSGSVNFDFDAYAMNPAAEEILLEGCEKMSAHPGSVIEIAGHTDKTGSANYNLLLGEKRANSCKLYMADHCGISLYRLFVVSYGENKPVAMADEMSSSTKNRRVTLKVWGKLQ
jgi:peptidoglycan-associated lipoprotein